MTVATSITVRVPLTLRRRPGRTTVVTLVQDGTEVTLPARADPTLVKALARAYRYQQALAPGREALTEARALKHAPSFVVALASGCHLHFLARDRQVVREYAEELEGVCAGRGALLFLTPFNLAMARLFRSWTLSTAGDHDKREEEIAQMQEALAAYRATGGGPHVPQSLGLLADAHRRAGRPRRGVGSLDEALALAERSGVRSFEAELHRIRGELVLALPSGDPEPCFRQAIEVARAQEAKMWELRAAVSLARLWRDQKRCAEARDLLAPVYGWFTEGFDLLELREARALLEELGESPKA